MTIQLLLAEFVILRKSQKYQTTTKDKQAKNRLDFVKCLWLSQFQACPSPSGICRAFVILSVPVVRGICQKTSARGGAFVNSSRSG